MEHEPGMLLQPRHHLLASVDPQVVQHYVNCLHGRGDLPFQSPSGALMRYPGDTSLGAGANEIVACRCDCEYNFNFAAAYARSRGR